MELKPVDEKLNYWKRTEGKTYNQLNLKNNNKTTLKHERKVSEKG